MQRLNGKVAIVTGAGRGLGKAFALRYAEEGAKLFLPDISLERAEKTAEAIRSMGGEAVAVRTDISDETDTRAMAENIMQVYGRVDILLNNAALSYGIEPRPWNAWEHAMRQATRGTRRSGRCGGIPGLCGFGHDHRPVAHRGRRGGIRMKIQTVRFSRFSLS